MEVSEAPNPVPDLLQQRQWEQLQCLSTSLLSLQRLPVDLVANGDRWRQWICSPNIHKALPPLWGETASLECAFEAMLILKVIREESVTPRLQTLSAKT